MVILLFGSIHSTISKILEDNLQTSIQCGDDSSLCPEALKLNNGYVRVFLSN